MMHILSSQKVRGAVLQALYLSFWAGLITTFVLVARSNLAESNIVSGFDFLWKSTGWKIGFSLIEFKASDTYMKALLVGVMNTLFLGVIGLVLATVVGMIVGMARTAANDLANLLGTIYVETFRNIPLIVQVFFWYAVMTRFPPPKQALSYGADTLLLSSRGVYFPGLNVTGLAALIAIIVLLVAVGLIVWVTAARRFRKMEPRTKLRLRAMMLLAGTALAALCLALGRIPETPLVSIPALKGFAHRGGIRVPPELSALAISMAIYGGAYIGEIVRGGFKSVGRGQIEAAQSIGLSPWQTFTQVRFPLALRAMLPILTNQYVWLIKATTMGIAIGFSDFFMIVSISINQSGQTLELIGILMGGFLIINFSLAAILNRINRAIAIKGYQMRA